MKSFKWQDTNKDSIKTCFRGSAFVDIFTGILLSNIDFKPLMAYTLLQLHSCNGSANSFFLASDHILTPLSLHSTEGESRFLKNTRLSGSQFQ